MSKHKQFGPEKKGGETGLDIECQGSWIEKETRQEKRQKKEERKLGARTRELYFFFAQNPRTWHEIQNKQKQEIKKNKRS